ncbi:MAG: hypothetical protein ACD_46C00301G0009 [uncultured bacterium]|nr:MAG: hypothetical protein ACD_46C00301G0009 [uncultured bacterium]
MSFEKKNLAANQLPLESVWVGVYERFEEVNGDQAIFEDKIWIKNQKEKILAKYNNLNKNNFMSEAAIANDYSLPLVVAMLLTSQPKVSVLDFGGGMGYEYLDVIAKVPMASQDLMYCVIDNQVTLSHLPSEITAMKNLSFCTNLNTVNSTFDIVHVGSVLQYIDDWQNILHQLALISKAKFFVFCDLLAGNIPSFVTQQNYYGKKTPLRFLNNQEFAKYMQTLGYHILYKTSYNPRQALGYYPNTGLPETHRITKHENWIFLKNNK